MQLHLTNTKPALTTFFRALPNWFRDQYIRKMLLAPMLVSGCVFLLCSTNTFGWEKSSTCKTLMEIVHPSLLAIAMLIALFNWFYRKDSSLAFMSILLAFTLSRELGGQGTSFILITGLILLIVYSYDNRDKLTTLLQSRLASSLLATGFICYALSQLLDRSVIKHIGRLILWDTSWKPPYSSQIEECLEAFGGSLLMLSVLSLVFLSTRKQNH